MVDRVEGGEHVTVTRDGRPVAEQTTASAPASPRRGQRSSRDGAACRLSISTTFRRDFDAVIDQVAVRDPEALGHQCFARAQPPVNPNVLPDIALISVGPGLRRERRLRRFRQGEP